MNKIDAEALSFLGFVRWRLRSDASLRFELPATEAAPSLDRAPSAAPVASDTVPDETQAAEIAVESEQVSHVTPERVEAWRCRISLPVDAEPALRHFVHDVIQVLQRLEIENGQILLEPNDSLPEAPAVCFIAEMDNMISKDREGRLLISAQCLQHAALTWKPQLWAFIQSMTQRDDSAI